MALKFWDYDRTMNKDEYSYKYFLHFRWGMSGSEFYEYNIKPMFKYYGYTYQQAFITGIDFDWEYIN